MEAFQTTTLFPLLCLTKWSTFSVFPPHFYRFIPLPFSVNAKPFRDTIALIIQQLFLSQVMWLIEGKKMMTTTYKKVTIKTFLDYSRYVAFDYDTSTKNYRLIPYRKSFIINNVEAYQRKWSTPVTLEAYPCNKCLTYWCLLASHTHTPQKTILNWIISSLITCKKV